MAAAAPRRAPTLTGGRLFLSGLFIFFKEEAASLMGLRGNHPSGQTCRKPRAGSE
jgi:hypothetical protein